jgi:imidazolonepropionase-like amidohydrolase
VKRAVSLIATFALAALLVAGPSGPVRASTQIPGPPQAQPIAIVGATVHTVSGPDIGGGTILFDKGVIVAVGAAAAVPPGARVIHAEGKHIYPGLIAAWSTIGLTEIDASRATRDVTEVGNINPSVRAEVAYNPDGEHIPVARSNGVLTALSVPEGGMVSGRAALMRMDGWTWEDLVVKAPVALAVTWPGLAAPAPEGDAKKMEENARQHQDRLRELKRAIADARAYLRARETPGVAGLPPHDVDQRWEAMIPVLKGEVPLLVRAESARDINEAVTWALGERLRMILVGAAEADHCIDLLKQSDIPVIINNVLREPARRDAPYDAPFTLAARLHEAGIPLAIAGGGSWGLRNLAYEAAMAAAFGLPADEALKSITLYPAQILGVGDRLGSLEPGKAATLFIADGDILEIPTQVEAAFIDGRSIDLDNKHKMLDRKYREKYRRLGLIK